MSAPTKQPVNALDQSTPSSATQSFVQQKQTSPSQGHPPSAEVPIGVLEIPVGVLGSWGVESISGLPDRLEVFAEETCTVIVFPHGAVIRLSAAVAPGQMIMVTNRKSRQEVFCRVVNVRKYPSAKGYAEIEFIKPTNGFWGDYIPHGTLKVTEQAKIPAATLEKPPKPDPIASKPASVHASIETPSAICPKPPVAASTPSVDFWSSSFPPEVISALAKTAIASPDAPTTVRTKLEPIGVCPIQTPYQRGESAKQHSALSWVRELLGSWPRSTSTRGATDKTRSPRRAMALVGATVVGLFMIGATGILLLHQGTAKSAATTQTNPADEASTFSILNIPSLQPESGSTSAVPLPPVVAEGEGFPGIPAREFAYNVPIFQPPARKTASEGKIPNIKLLAPHLAARRSAAAIDRGLPPDVTAVAPNAGTDAIQGVLAASLPVVGRVKEPRLVSKTEPIYPSAAKRLGIEGKVAVDADIDTAGKLTNMRVVSGSPLLQQATLDSLRNWKYEPGYLDDKPVQTKTSITVVFRLR